MIMDNLVFVFEKGALRVLIIGEINHHNVAEMREKIDQKIGELSPEKVVLDLSRLNFMDSSGIAVVINTLRNMTKLDGKLEISGLGQQPLKVFRASGIDKLVNIKEEVK